MNHFPATTKQLDNLLVYQLKSCCTCWESIPDFQPVVFAVSVAPWQGIILQVKGEEGEGDIHAGWHNDNERALQVMGVLVGEAWGLNEA